MLLGKYVTYREILSEKQISNQQELAVRSMYQNEKWAAGKFHHANPLNRVTPIRHFFHHQNQGHHKLVDLR